MALLRMTGSRDTPGALSLWETSPAGSHPDARLQCHGIQVTRRAKCVLFFLSAVGRVECCTGPDHRASEALGLAQSATQPPRPEIAHATATATIA